MSRGNFSKRGIAAALAAVSLLLPATVVIAAPEAKGGKPAAIALSFERAFTPAQADWGWVWPFWDRVFWPYLVGGIGPGIVAGLACYWVTVPLARAYQAGRRRALAERLARLRGEDLKA